MTGLRSIEFVGGPYCGCIARMTLSADIIALPDCIAGENIEYIYQSTERVSQQGAGIVEYLGKRVIGSVCEGGRAKAGE